MSTKTPNPKARASGTRLTKELVDQLLAGDPVLREDVDRRLASQITQPTGETAKVMAHSLATLQEMADDITIRQTAVHTARIRLIKLSAQVLEPITVDNATPGTTMNPISDDEFQVHLEVLQILAGVLRPAHKAATVQLDTKLLPIARQSALSSTKQTAVREMADAYGVGRQQMYKLVTNADAGSRQRPKVSATTEDLPRLHMSREEFQNVIDTITRLREDITTLLAEGVDDFGPLMEMLDQMGEHITDAEAAVHGARSTLLDLAATVLAPITYSTRSKKSVTADEYAVHLLVVRIVADVLRPDHERLTAQIEEDLQTFAVNAVVSAARNSAVARTAMAYGVARQNVLRLVNAAHPGFLGALRFKNTTGEEAGRKVSASLRQLMEGRRNLTEDESST
jgi:hypothetical protein